MVHHLIPPPQEVNIKLRLVAKCVSSGKGNIWAERLRCVKALELCVVCVCVGGVGVQGIPQLYS